MLPTLLKGESLATWVELNDNEKKDFDVAKAKLIKILTPLKFVSLEEFQKCAIFPGESVRIYFYKLN